MLCRQDDEMGRKDTYAEPINRLLSHVAEKKGLLILAQVDHLSGEDMACALDQILRRGAYNAHIIPGFTKKNRASFLLLIDIEPDSETKWANFLAEEYGIYGYQQLKTSHYHMSCYAKEIKVLICKGGKVLETQATFKIPLKTKKIGRIEHSDLVRIHAEVKKKLNARISLSRLRARFEAFADTKVPELLVIDI
jgi:uncharacterized protein (DUF111 family)